MEYHSGLKRNELSTHDKIWRINANERSQSKKSYIMYDSNHISSAIGKTVETVKQSVVAKG